METSSSCSPRKPVSFFFSFFLSLSCMHCTCTMTLSESLRDDRRRWATRTRYTNDEDLHLRPKHHQSIIV
ncbi:hypothetical protein BDV39DRAFT_187895 [Aspergillus sergii]|uniref:Uncharacterized protein n=1 Tax=Aspergillus sergii TaxID=1034303 RepID=A0A5N6WID9_9EURO|nr:hypothetical protein BDV39DRAFT_187895 [Aspergillus sergii]